MTISDFMNTLLESRNHEFIIYTDSDVPDFEGFGSEIPEPYKEAVIDYFDIGRQAIEIVIK